MFQFDVPSGGSDEFELDFGDAEEKGNSLPGHHALSGEVLHACSGFCSHAYVCGSDKLNDQL